MSDRRTETVVITLYIYNRLRIKSLVSNSVSLDRNRAV